MHLLPTRTLSLSRLCSTFDVRSSIIRLPPFSVRRSLVPRPIPCCAFAGLLPEDPPARPAVTADTHEILNDSLFYPASGIINTPTPTYADLTSSF